MHFYVPALGSRVCDGKARRTAKAEALTSGATQPAAGLAAQPFGKAGERPGPCVAQRLRYPYCGALCALSPGLSPAFAGT